MMRVPIVLCVLSLIALPVQGQLQTSRKVAAQALFDRGRSLMKERKYPEAAALFEQSEALEEGVGTRLYLADCYERMGRLASAWVLFREAASAAAERGEAERAQKGSQRAALLEPQLPHVILEPDSRVPGLTITLNGVALPETAWGMPWPVDPGDILIEWLAPGYQVERVSRTVAVGGEPVAIALPTLVPLRETPTPTPAPAALPAVSQSAAISGTPPQALRVGPSRDELSGRSWQRPTAVVAGGAALVAIGVGSYFGIRAISRNRDAERLCPNSMACTNAVAIHDSDQANRAATLSNGFVLGGVIVAGVGLVLWLTAPSSSGPKVRVDGNARARQLSLRVTF